MKSIGERLEGTPFKVEKQAKGIYKFSKEDEEEPIIIKGHRDAQEFAGLLLIANDIMREKERINHGKDNNRRVRRD